MSSAEFFTLVRDHLTDDGVMVVNMNMRSDEEGNITDYLSDTIALVFDNVYTADVIGSTNRELYASQDPQMTARFSDALASMDNEKLKSIMLRVGDELTPYEGGELILTDDKAPVELLGMRMIDGIISHEVSYFKDAYKEGGLDALLGLL